jgi:Ca-activated chloride channel family protein
MRRVDVDSQEPKRPWPSWVASLILHAALFIVFALTATSPDIVRGIVGDPSREIAGEIVLKHLGEDGQGYYEGQDNVQTPTSPQSSVAAADLLNNAPQVTPSVKLPSGEIGTPTVTGGGGSFGSEALTGNPSQPKPGGGTGTKTKFYGVEAEGNSFVFVLDRSASMETSGRLRAAKTELLDALKYLKETNQFRIIFFNGDFEEFRPRGKLSFFANAPTLLQAEKYIGGIVANGDSRGFHPALRQALRYNPDVIYFLTDAEDIFLSDSELGILRRMNSGASIHVIKFGEGAEERVAWLVKLCRDNAGQYRYVDTRQFRQE